MTETIPDYPQLTEEQRQRGNRAAKLTNSIKELTGILSDRLWNDPAYDGIKDRWPLLAMIDASHSAAKELEDIVLEQ